jgi:hypothetical protein
LRELRAGNREPRINQKHCRAGLPASGLPRRASTTEAPASSAAAAGGHRTRRRRSPVPSGSDAAWRSFGFNPATWRDSSRYYVFELPAIELVRATPAASAVFARNPALSYLANGRVAAMGGVLPLPSGGGFAWSLMARDAGPFTVAITRGARRFLDSLDFPRIETPIFTDTPLSIRWIELLGFQREDRMRAYTPDGRDAISTRGFGRRNEFPLRLLR